MKLQYYNKRSAKEILTHTKPATLNLVRGKPHAKNKIIMGNNLQVMQSLIKRYNMKNQVDLVYIDPPFSTNTVYKQNDERTATISSSNDDEVAYTDELRGPEFIEFLRERLILIRELMAEHASIYLHIDYKIGHYVKIIMDEIFGEKNFRNDITRIKCNPKNFARKGYSNIKDLILFYTKTDNFIWNEPRQEMTSKDIKTLFPKVDKQGRRYTTTPLHAPGETRNGNTGKPWRGMLPPKGRHWRYDPSVLDELDSKGLIEWSKTSNPRKVIYASEAEEKGKRVQDIWEFKDSPYPSYPTEKNIELLKLIITTSSNPGQTVLDCFCGSGSTLLAAQRLNRYWVGIDLSPVAIKRTLERFTPSQPELFDSSPDYQYLEQLKDTKHQPHQEITVSSSTYRRRISRLSP